MPRVTARGRYESCMLLFYRRRGIVEISKVQLQSNHHAQSLLPMPLPYTSIIPAANADIRADTVSFELSSPVCPAQVATISLSGRAPPSIASSKSCHGSLLQDRFDVRMVRLSSCSYARNVMPHRNFSLLATAAKCRRLSCCRVIRRLETRWSERTARMARA